MAGSHIGTEGSEGCGKPDTELYFFAVRVVISGKNPNNR